MTQNIDKMTEDQLIEFHDELRVKEFFKGLTEEERQDYEEVKDTLWQKYRL
jgi:hypothetical protein